MFITGLGTATPTRRYTQLQCWEALAASEQFARLTTRSRAILKKVLAGKNGIASRHLALEPLTEAFDICPDTLMARFTRHAPVLAEQAARRALAEAETAVDQIEALLISTCTGYLCPGLTSYVGERLGLRNDVLALDLVGQGCGAALPNLRTGASLLQSGQANRVLSVCVEICSAAFYLDDDPGVLISACLFGDGAAAAVLSATPQPGTRRVEWKTAGSLHSPKERDFLRFESKGGMLRNVLSPSVPALAARHARTVFDEVSARCAVKQEDIAGWILHAGGRDVLNALCETFSLGEEKIEASSRILEEYGNLSSPFVLFALQFALGSGLRGGKWWCSSFGAGFSCHGALLEVA
ncbi:MAG TPA: 3-oxoacyl-[acyl-carrier-protein] synthase III C-terminal domain-containing protein [Verrucomicrobiae bacterium]|nr:3-oxoacyl-[acyl-carrier-protein] synthase III C-terminal domain-containing protein [Verrucomicrobiae bacterium]